MFRFENIRTPIEGWKGTKLPAKWWGWSEQRVGAPVERREAPRPPGRPRFGRDPPLRRRRLLSRAPPPKLPSGNLQNDCTAGRRPVLPRFFPLEQGVLRDRERVLFATSCG